MKYLCRTTDYKAFVLARCDCGKEKELYLDHLIRKKQTVKSCGCYNKELAKERLLTHGESGKKPSPEFIAWSSMKQRCYYAKHKDYESYGGRGIIVCDEWRNDFSKFLKDMGRKPSAKHSIDRINNNGNYEPSNCRWATPNEQARNRRTTISLTYKGHTKTLHEWSKITGISTKNISRRLRYGWSTARALNEPLRKWPSEVN